MNLNSPYINSPQVRPLVLPTMRMQQARIRSALATGLSLPFIREGLAGRLHLQRVNESELTEELSPHRQAAGGAISAMSR